MYITAKNRLDFGLRVKDSIYEIPITKFEKRRWKIVEYIEKLTEKYKDFIEEFKKELPLKYDIGNNLVKVYYPDTFRDGRTTFFIQIEKEHETKVENSNDNLCEKLLNFEKKIGKIHSIISIYDKILNQMVQDKFGEKFGYAVDTFKNRLHIIVNDRHYWWEVEKSFETYSILKPDVFPEDTFNIILIQYDS